MDLPILSKKAHDFFESDGIGEDDVEYLSFILKNKKGNVARGDFCLTRATFKETANGRVATVQILELYLTRYPMRSRSSDWVILAR